MPAASSLSEMSYIHFYCYISYVARKGLIADGNTTYRTDRTAVLHPKCKSKALMGYSHRKGDPDDLRKEE